MSSETRTPEALTGRSLSHYQLLEKVGAGGMGVVYRALDTRLDRQVAIKVLAPEGILSADRKRRFVQEARTASALNHPNIITIYDIDNVDGRDFIVMEYVRGKTLGQWIGNKGLRLCETLKYAAQIADALAAAHAIGIVHRDLKPANVMVVQGQGTIKVLDFGLAKLIETTADSDPAVTQTMDSDELPKTIEGKVFGTVAYMSPEQAEGKPVDARSDIFSFGSVLYEMVTGRRAFQGETKMSILAAVIRDEPRTISEVADEVPRELVDVIGLCLRKDLDRRFQHMTDVKLLLENLKEKCDAGALEAAPVERRKSRRAAWLIALCGVAALLGMAGVWWARAGASAESPTLTRLTWDSGLTQDPVLSPDGRLLAYASDRYGEGNLDIWAQHLSGGEPIRLTRNEADEENPSFSPDSGRIAFRSDRDGGGIYVVPALGGQERLIAPSGQNPKFSPDGRLVVYWVGEPSNFAPSGKVYVVSASGGKPVQIQPDLADARYPTWTPDGMHILLQGVRTAQEEADWWVAPVNAEGSSTGAAVKTGAFAALRREGLSVHMGAGGFRDGRIVFSANSASARSLFQIPISTRTWKTSGKVQRLTFGTALDAEPFPNADGRLVFVSLTLSNNVWLLPVDSRGETGSTIRRVTEGTAYDATPSCSRDGTKLVFTSGRLGNRDVWIKDLKTGREAALTATPADEISPVISPDGARAAYSVSGLPVQPIYIIGAGIPAGSSVPEKICDDCGEPVDWSPDGNTILYVYGRQKSIGLLQVGSGRKSVLFQDARHGFDEAQFSPDGAWISLVRYTEANHTRVLVLPFHEGTAVAPEDQWVPITDGASWDDHPRWSPDGRQIYFYSKRDGFGCIWKQAVDRATKRPVGPATAVHHFHSSRLSMMHMMSNRVGISVASDKLVFNLLEVTGNVWMMR